MDRVKFKVNGEECSVGSEVSSETMLVDLIRDKLELHGTKYMCREGGCGACIVAAVRAPGGAPVAVNSCLVGVTSCHGWDVSTVERLGDRLAGYHPVQRTLADHNGTQCGYCSPGWVMAMYSLLQNNKDLTMLDIEKSFASNICRCTGYRPILEAFKTFAKDAPKRNLIDIEDLNICKRSGTKCLNSTKCENTKFSEDDWCLVSVDDVVPRAILRIKLKDGKIWYKAEEIEDVFKIFNSEGVDSYMLVAGNTAKGAYPIAEYPRALIDVSTVSALKGHSLDQNLIVGAGSTLAEFMSIMQLVAQEDDFQYLFKLYKHLELVAHIPVRNLGTIAGNLMTKHQHPEFPSDVFLLLETVGADLTILTSLNKKQILTMQQFLNTDMKGRIILNVLLPPLNQYYQLITYKIMQRAQNVHAVVNAGFLFKLDKLNKTVVECRLVLGGLSPSFIRASTTEALLVGKDLFTNTTLQTAIRTLDKELVVVENPPEPSAAYRRRLALGLFYKCLLELCPAHIVNPRYASGAISLPDSRPLSTSHQQIYTDPAIWPLNQPIPKIDALIQCAGESVYTNDKPKLPHEVFAAFVFSTIATGKIASIDATNALELPEVLAFYTAKDIPGINTFTPAGDASFASNEELLCSGTVKYYNQPIGVIVAKSQKIAEKAAGMVNIQYKQVTKPVLDVKVNKTDSNRVTLYAQTDAKTKGSDVQHVINSSNTIYWQYHFTMELLGCVTHPTEEGLAVYPTSQHLDAVQIVTSRVLNIDENRIDVHVRRLGGGFGIKGSRILQVAVACNLVTYKLNRPCRFILPLTNTMRSQGKRLPCSVNYEIGVNKSGEIQYLNYDMYQDYGHMVNEPISVLTTHAYWNCYDSSRWNFKCYNVTTDTPKNTWCRGPGTLESVAMAEIALEQISYELSLDALEVRLINLDNKHSAIKEMVADLKIQAQYSERRKAVDEYNSENRWKKRGLRFTLLRWTTDLMSYYLVTLSVFRDDGSVALVHSGIEMGQGIDTKAIQVCAYLLKIPIDKIKVKANNTMIAPNAFQSADSLPSQNIIVGVRKCCDELLKRLEPIRQQMDNPTWEELTTKAFESSVNLQTHGFVAPADIIQYDIYGVSLAETEIDVLTGESQVIRVDIMQDVGQSVSPEIDIGQIEGAFVMGLGYFTSEKLVFDKDSGELLTNRTWDYYVPQARDIPQDFRVYFRKDSKNSNIFFGAKATGEPPMCMSYAVPLAHREAITSARSDSGISSTEWFTIDGPFNVENICMSTATKLEEFKYN